MRVALISTHDREGGAGRAAYRLLEALPGAGVDARMYVQERKSRSPSVVQLGSRAASLRGWIDRFPPGPRRGKAQPLFSLGAVPSRMCSGVNAWRPDIVHLHWVNRGFLGLGALPKFRAPLVWTLHDLWPFTGGCHYDGKCGRYGDRCGRCPALGARREEDLSRWIWRRKERAYRALDLTVVAPSRWLAREAAASSLFRGRRIEVIPYGLDLERFRPRDPIEARRALGLPTDRRVVLFGAVNAASDERKGFAHLRTAVEILADSGWRHRVELVVFGAGVPEAPGELGLPATFLGSIADEDLLARAYAAADVFVLPSVQDNLPNTILEALACGTPCAAFRIGGMEDLIDPGGNGALAAPFDAADLAASIAWILEDEARHRALRAQARAKAEREYRPELQASRYGRLYGELADARPGQGET